MNISRVRENLENEFIRRREKSSSYSLRAYARFLDVDPGSLSRFLRGEKIFSEKNLLRMSLQIGASDQELHTLFHQSGVKFLDQSSYEVTSKWYYLAILECFDLDEFEASPKWLARKLNLSAPIVQVAINNLLRVGLLEISEEGSWVRVFNQTSSSRNEDVDEIALRNLQKTHLDLARHSIDFANAKTKSHSSLTTAIDPQIIPKIKEEIRKFRKRINEIAMNQSEKKSDIYCLQINWFEAVENKGGKNVD